jgi:splicing factor 3A subunit 1
MIPVSEYEQHVKLELMDPKYFDTKNQLAERTKNTSSASNQDFSKNLANFASKRSNITSNTQ